MSKKSLTLLSMITLGLCIHSFGFALAQEKQDENKNQAEAEAIKQFKQQYSQQLGQYYLNMQKYQNLNNENLNQVYSTYWNTVQQQKDKPKYWIGVQCEPAGNVPILADIPHVEKLFHQGGLKVSSVVENGPAAKAGIKKGDVIVSFDGAKLNSIAELSAALEKSNGKKVQVVLIRDQKSMVVEVSGQQRSDAENTRPEYSFKFQPEWHDYWSQANGNRVNQPNMQYWLQAMAYNIQLPDDVEITFSKKGNSAGTVVVKQKDAKWNLAYSGSGWLVQSKSGNTKLPSAVKVYLDSTIRSNNNPALSYYNQGAWIPYTVQWEQAAQWQKASEQSKKAGVDANELMKRIDKMAKDLEELKKSAAQMKKSDK